MNENQSAIRNISDTALWVAVYRARETERPDALFRDPFARRLAGERGERIAESISFSNRVTWAWMARTYLFDQLISEQVQQGANLVINLAAGLDARPYRMELPSSLHWIEVDLPDILAYKEEILRGERPVCMIERVRLDLGDPSARRELFAQLGRGASQALIISEGLLIYLSAEEAGTLAEDLAMPPSFKHWAFDIVSPGLLQISQRNMGQQINQSGASLKFGPKEGPPFFERHGWMPADIRSILKTAGRLKRLPFLLRLVSILPESSRVQGMRPWGGVCLMAKK